MNQINYKKYIVSEAWKSKREQVLRFWVYRCAICDSPHKLHVHHRTYKRLGYERLSDLIALCADCHAIFHKRLPQYHDPELIQDVLKRIVAQVKAGVIK